MPQNLLDRIDLAILDRLQHDGRMTNQALSAAINLSPSACLARVRALEQAGIIAGYQAKIAIERVAPTVTILAEVTLRSHHPEDFARFERTVAGIETIVEVLEVSGSFDYLLKVAVSDIQSWRALSDRLLGEPLGIDKIMSHVVMKQVKAFAGFPVLADVGGGRPTSR